MKTSSAAYADISTYMKKKKNLDSTEDAGRKRYGF